MSRFEFKLPDLGEGTVEAEIIQWHVQPGHRVAEDDIIVDVMTDKANIEIPSPVTGTVLATTGEPGDLVPVGSVLIVFETDASATVEPVAKPPPAAVVPLPKPVEAVPIEAPSPAERATPTTTRVLASPSVRRRAREANVDLAAVTGSGPDGRITSDDFDAYLDTARTARPVRQTPARQLPLPDEDPQEIKVIGVRRVIAQRLSESSRTIPHFAYVEEVDITELEALRAHLNATRDAKLTYLPFLALALIRALPQFPQCNAHYDAERGVLLRHRRVHLGIATQSSDGLKVPVVRDAHALNLWELSQQIQGVAAAVRNNSASREQLTGSTITLTSLGRLGGIASTPIINAPEVAIIGVNKAVQRPMVQQGSVAIRLMMNLSSSFDHRFVDGYDAAGLIQALKECLEHPAVIFIP
jgi:2-oxoisovalerate dehydrogenase E2 component (dihydrolipoyl transacylase)